MTSDPHLKFLLEDWECTCGSNFNRNAIVQVWCLPKETFLSQAALSRVFSSVPDSPTSSLSCLVSMVSY